MNINLRGAKCKNLKNELSKPLSPKIVIHAKMRMSEFVRKGMMTKIKKSV